MRMIFKGHADDADDADFGLPVAVWPCGKSQESVDIIYRKRAYQNKKKQEKQNKTIFVFSPCGVIF